MPAYIEAYHSIIKQLAPGNITLVAVSKTKPVSDILELYQAGQRDFGENYVQELVEKQAQLPADIRWHFIGHLQSNKVRSIAPFVYLIHGVDSERLLTEINKQAHKNGRIIDCLLQVHIAQEETKFGLDEEELEVAMRNSNTLQHVKVRGLMGMASFTHDMEVVKKEFQQLKRLFDGHFSAGGDAILSMGMSSDYLTAIAEGSNMVRIGSLLFGERTYNN